MVEGIRPDPVIAPEEREVVATACPPEEMDGLPSCPVLAVRPALSPPLPYCRKCWSSGLPKSLYPMSDDRSGCGEKMGIESCGWGDLAGVPFVHAGGSELAPPEERLRRLLLHCPVVPPGLPVEVVGSG